VSAILKDLREQFANIGIATGPESGFLVLDVDPRSDEWQRLFSGAVISSGVH